MYPVSKLVEDVADNMQTPRETVALYARALMDAGLLPKARGRAVPVVDVGDIVRLMLVCAIAPKIKDAPAIVAAYENLVEDGVPSSHPDFPAKRKLGAVLVEMFNALLTLSNEDRSKWKDASVEFVTNWPEARIHMNRGDDTRDVAFAPIGQPVRSWNGYVRRVSEVHAKAIVFLGFNAGREYAR